MTRKTFLGGFGAAFGSAVLPATAFAKAGEPIMRFGVASDVHIAVGWKEGGDPERLGLRSQPYFLEKALRWFDANKADAVVFSGDMAHTGRMEELEKLVEVWNKGITFVGAHYPRGTDYQKGWHRPDYSGFFAAHAAELRQNKPFFYVQHGHPAHTCYGEDARGRRQGVRLRDQRACGRTPDSAYLHPQSWVLPAGRPVVHRGCLDPGAARAAEGQGGRVLNHAARLLPRVRR